MPPIERCPTGGYFRRSTTSRASAAISTCGMTIPSAPLSRARVAIEYSPLGTRAIGAIPASSAAVEICAQASSDMTPCSISRNSQSKPATAMAFAISTLRVMRMRDDAAGPGGDQASDDDVLLQPLQVVDSAGDRRLCEDAGRLLERGR